MRRCALIALGGNALCTADQEGTYAEQRENARAMAAPIGELIDAGWRVVVVHGNGPQVGALAVQQEAAAATIPAQPLSSLCAMTQGYLGSLISLALRERLGPGRQVVSVVTHVVVHGDDPGFAAPSKPIGQFLSESDARRLGEAHDWTVGDDQPESIYGKPVAWINASVRDAADAHASFRTVLVYAHATVVADEYREAAVVPDDHRWIAGVEALGH